jgi:hypothetical protein
VDGPQRRAADIAYACYLFIGACFAAGELLVLRYSSDKDFGALQAIGMLVLLPLTLLSLIATLAGIVLSLKLRRWWSQEWGLAVLPVLLLAFMVAVAIEAQSKAPFFLLPYVEAAYAVSSLVFSIRWFGAVRRRA